jgi:sugar phosphate isomerase/epimerase
MNLILSGRTQMMDAYPVPEALGRMKSLGFAGAEICVENLGFGIRPELFDAAYLAEVAATAKDLELDAWSYSYHADYIRDDEVLDRTIQAIRLTPTVGTDTFVFSGGRVDKLAYPQEEWRTLVTRTRVLAREAQANGVRLALEPEPGFICGTSAQLLRLMDEVDSPSLCCNMDVGHAFLCDPFPLESIRELGDRIVHCHLEDMRRGVHDHLLPGDGDMDLPAFVRALEALGCSGPAALDLYGYDYEQVAPGAMKYLRAVGGQ